MESIFSKDYFTLFSLPVAYDVDQEALTQRYREMQGMIHPDRFVNATAKERRVSVQMTALSNEAYQTLKSPLKRARYLLQLRGADIDDAVTNKDIAFLTEQIELRERLDEVRASDDIESELHKFASELQSRIVNLQQALQGAFADDVTAGLAKAQRLYDEMQFISRLNDELNEIEDARD